ncbi:hypothetical protein POM88_015651 [Heracleum sosnowskyi]|uniref:Uncharacterized protein n=1 Tax=Heracleum sosnowskyi TaxID=360622 RepID=A0AAD8ILU0_9APIA|nr:hypothetical protein POM88_015651 [Heracleum sosnowskyi]
MAMASDVVTEGKVYDIRNFNTRIATGTLRPVLSNYCIDFTNESIIIPVLQDDFTLPFHKFEFTDLANLTDIVNSYPETKCPEYSIELIGVVQDLQEPTLVPTIYGEMQLVRFKLTDGRFSYKVNIWTDDIPNFDIFFKDDLQCPIVIILASARLCKFLGIVEIATLPSTKIYINLEIDYVLRFRQRLAVDGFQDIAGTIRDIERVGFIQTHVGQKNFVRFVLFDGSVSVKVTVWDENIVVLNQILENNFEEIPIVVLATMRARLFLSSVQVSTTYNSRIYINITYDPILHIRQRPIKEMQKMMSFLTTTVVTLLPEDFSIPMHRLEEEGYISHGNTTSEPLPTLPPPIIQIVTLKELGDKSDSDDAKNNQTDIYPSTIKEIVGKECIFTVEMSDDNLLIQSKIFKVKDARDTSIATPSASQATLASGSNSSYADNIIELSNFAGTPGSVKSYAKKIKTVKNKLTFL